MDAELHYVSVYFAKNPGSKAWSGVEAVDLWTCVECLEI